MDFTIAFVCAIVVLGFILVFMGSCSVIKIELLFVDNIPIVLLHKRRFFLFLSTYVEKHKNLQNTYIRSKTVSSGRYGGTRTVYELILECKRENKNISKFPLDSSANKKIVVFENETSDKELKQFSDKLNKALDREEDCIISTKDIKDNLKECILMYIICCPLSAFLLGCATIQYKIEKPLKEVYINFACGYLIDGLILAFLIYMSFRVNRESEKSKYGLNLNTVNQDYLNNFDEDENAKIDKINNSIIK